jgi:16S rRNA (cytidine1402-2'-O)-methyltransferase
MSSPAIGRLVLVPNTLDLGNPEAAPAIQDVLPLGVMRIAAGLGHWVVENARTTRAFLKRVHEVVPLAQPLQDIRIVELPRPAKGRAATQPHWPALLAPALQGHDLGLCSEAGMPAVADPGAALVAAAHASGVPVWPLAGPSALVMALAASGLHGQGFTFSGYVPVDTAERGARIRELETASRRLGQTQIVIETPYRNGALLQALLANLQPGTRLCVSCGLTLAVGWTRTETVAAWRNRSATLPGDVPAVFAFQA